MDHGETVRRRPRLAIVGTGIAGLGCAWFLREKFDLTLFEQNDYAGGHTNTIDVPDHLHPVAFDTGFMVFNRVTYPHLCRFFEDLKVPVKPTSMSFSVQHVPAGLEFCGSGWNHLFAQRRNIVRPRFWRLLAAIHRFNGEAVRALTNPRWKSATVADFLEAGEYGGDFRDLYLIPMGSAVWSTPGGAMLEFPVLTLLRFFHNHGFLGLHTQHPWWTVDGGAREYVRRLWPLFGDRVRLGTPVRRITRTASGTAMVALAGGTSETFDRIILACHANQALQLLSDATPTERRLLGEFRYQPNLATVHSDASVMPSRRLAWSAWNHRVDASSDGETRAQTVYWMNRLQDLKTTTQYFVSINGEDRIAPGRILRQISYEHPLFSVGAVRAQEELPLLNRQSPAQPVFFAGSYFRYGFHEDAFASALDCSRAVTDADAMVRT